MNATESKPTIASGIAAIGKRWPELVSQSVEEPLFVLAAGWRSGSTLLQRMLMPRAFIWGEPYGHAGLVDSLADPLRAFTASWPEDECFHQGQSSDALRKRFIANLTGTWVCSIGCLFNRRAPRAPSDGD